MIFLNDIPSFRAPESEELIIDDRLTKVELMNGVALQDLGRVEAGDVFSLQCMFSEENYSKIEALCRARAKVNYKDEAGTIWQDVTIKILRIRRDRRYPKYRLVTFELWRC